MAHRFPLRILVVGLLAFIIGWVGIAFSFCIENCSNRDNLVRLPAIIIFFAGIVVMTSASVMALYRSKLPKKVFWGIAIGLCVIVPAVSLAVKHKNTVTHQKEAACFSHLKPGEAPLKCHYIK